MSCFLLPIAFLPPETNIKEQKGKAEGIAEEQRHITAQLKKRGVAPEIIAQCTGLSIEEIDML